MVQKNPLHEKNHIDLGSVTFIVAFFRPSTSVKFPLPECGACFENMREDRYVYLFAHSYKIH